MTSYSSQFNQEVRKRLQSLRGQIDEDLPRLEDLSLNLTFRQADELLGGIDSSLETYKSAMEPHYQTARRSRTSGTGGTSSYQRRKDQTQQIARMEDEAIPHQGYVIAAAITAASGYRESTVLKTLDQLASEHGWERRQDRETQSPRYKPKAKSAPSGGS